MSQQQEPLNDDLDSLLRPTLIDNLTYAPQFFRLRDADSREQLKDLVKATPSLTIVDSLVIQLTELLRLRHPAHRYTPSELQEQLRQQIGDAPTNVYGVWVYYPWSQRLVHLLDEAEFTELRTYRNHYKLTPQEQQVLATKKVGVIGLCAGQVTALTMALERSFGEIRLADFDTLDLSNMNRLQNVVQHIGLPKVVLVAREIVELDPFLRVICYFDGIHERNIDQFLKDGGNLDVLVEESDSLDVKLLARYRARKLGIPVITYASDHEVLDVERFDLERNRALFHGLLESMEYSQLKNLSKEATLLLVGKITGAERLPKRMKNELIDVDGRLYTWPQLASSVAIGGALTAEVARRILLKRRQESGRFPVDVKTILALGIL